MQLPETRDSRDSRDSLNVPDRARGHPARRAHRRPARWAALVATAALVTAVSAAAAGCTGQPASTAAGSAAGPPAAGSAAGAPAAGSAASGNDAGTAAVVSQQTVAAAARSRIVTAQVSLRVADVAAAVGVATRLTTGAGGYVADSKQVAAPAGDRQQPTGPSATVTLRVPPERLTGVLDQVARLGTVTDSRRTEADVTGKVADLDARLRTQQVSLQRLRGLFARAGTLSEITALEQALTAREAELESTQAQRKALAGQVDDATVTLDVLGAADTVRAAAPGGFGPGLRAGWSALGGTVRVGSTVIGALLPFLPIAAVAAGFVVWRRRARRSSS